MATFDDTVTEGKLRIYDKGFDEDSRSYGEYIGRSGGIFCPQIPSVEPLRRECEHFLETISNGTQPRSDGSSGLRVVRVLERLQEDLECSRRTVPAHPPPASVRRGSLRRGSRADASAGVLVEELQRFAGRTGT